MCTGFAVYYDETFYGMNFDFINVDLNFRIHEYSDRKVFMFYYKQKRIDIAVAGMNSFGLFANYQVKYFYILIRYHIIDRRRISDHFMINKKILWGSIFIILSGIIYEAEKILSYFKWAVDIYMVVNNRSSGYNSQPAAVNLSDNYFIIIFMVIGLCFYINALLTYMKK